MLALRHGTKASNNVVIKVVTTLASVKQALELTRDYYFLGQVCAHAQRQNYKFKNGACFDRPIEGYNWLMPPSAISSVPTIKAESAEDMNSTVLASSSDVPKRLSGICS